MDLQLQNVCVGYGDREVLRDVSFRVVAGEMLGLVGPNGSGKSTLIKAISRVIPAESGSILIDGKEVNAYDRMELARVVAVVPQDPLLPATFTALEVVLMGRTPHLGFLRYEGRADMAVVWQAMGVTRTRELAYRRMGELSGGEKQRVCIARALAQEPRIILLDEPTSHLDIGFQLETLELIAGLCVEDGLTVLAAMHDLNLAAQYCDRLVMLDSHGVYSAGTPHEVITADNIRKVYGTEIEVAPHPVNGLPTTLVTANGIKAAERDRARA